MFVCDVKKAYPKKSSFPLSSLLQKAPSFQDALQRKGILALTKNYISATKPTICYISPTRSIQQQRWSRCVEELRFQQKSRHPSTKPGRADPRWEDRDWKSSNETHAQPGWRQMLAWQRLLGMKLRRPHEESELNKAWHSFSDRLLMR